MRKKRLALVLVVAIVAVAVIGYFANSLLFVARGVSIDEIVSDPQSFDGAYVRLQGYVVDTRVYIFGPKYVLRDLDDRVEIALGSSEKVDLEPYVSFVFDGKNYTEIRNIRASVVGYVRYIGFVTDAPPFYLDVEKVEPSVGRR